MTTKRPAASQLTQENWDQEDEDSGEINTFSVASKEVLERRIIKRGRRRKLQNPGEEESKPSVFSGFSGFNKSTPVANKGFDFLAKLTNGSGDTPKSNGFTMNTNADAKPTTIDAKPTSSNPDTIPEISDEYFAKLKGLNESVSKWIKSHVDKDPFCLLTPIFQDYEKYLKDIEKIRYKNSTDSIANKTSIFTTSSSENKSTIFTSKSDENDITGRDTNMPSTSSSSASPMIIPGFTSSSSSNTSFSFGDKKTALPTSTTSPPFSFGSFTTTTPATSNPLPFGSSSTPFSFSGGKPFTFAADNKLNVSNTEQEPKTNEDEDEPPKVEFTPVVEENSVFDKKCKIFVKTDGNFGDRGVGTLYIKPIDNSEKYQLIVRANTNLGNLLLNLVLNTSIPLQRMGKNNVMLVCIPTTESKPPPVPVLIRVKTSEEADDLLEMLKKYQK